jgi:thioredoxin-like negative regulator of GroEL
MNATCKETGRILQAIADRQPPLIIVKMNVDENPSTWRTYNIRSIPTLIVYQGGQIKKTITGKIEHHMYELEPYL